MPALPSETHKGFDEAFHRFPTGPDLHRGASIWRPMVVNHDYRGNSAIRDGKWKLVGKQLFALESDLKETTDLSGKHPDLVEKMMRTLAEYQQGGRSR